MNEAGERVTFLATGLGRFEGAHMLKQMIKGTALFKRLSKTRRYVRCRGAAGDSGFHSEYFDDRHLIGNGVPPLLMPWPPELKRPRVGVIRDPGRSPRWTKYVRFLEINGFDWQIYDIHSSSWLEKAAEYDLIVGMCCCTAYRLEQARRKVAVLVHQLDKTCYPSTEDLLL